MGFIRPNLPVVDVAEWSTRSRAERIVPMARHIAEHGFGTPLVMHVMYGVKIALYILGAWLFAWSPPALPRGWRAIEPEPAGLPTLDVVIETRIAERDRLVFTLVANSR